MDMAENNHFEIMEMAEKKERKKSRNNKFNFVF
jgi:hypothetical protein